MAGLTVGPCLPLHGWPLGVQTQVLNLVQQGFYPLVCFLGPGAESLSVTGCFSGLLFELGDSYVDSPMCATKQ